MTDEAPEQEQATETEDQTAAPAADLSTPGVAAGGKVKLQTVGPIPTTFIAGEAQVGPRPTEVAADKVNDLVALAKANMVKIKEVKEG